MNITVTKVQGAVPVTVFNLQGDLADQDTLVMKAKEAHDQGARHLLLDMSDVPFVSSAGLRALHTTYMAFRQVASPEEESEVRRGIAAGTYRSRHLKLLNPSKNALKALSVAGYDLFLEIHNDYRKAVSSFG
jgi:hypothetical protein